MWRLRLVLVVGLVISVGVAAAIYTGQQHPPEPIFAYAQPLPDGTQQLILYDVETRYKVPVGAIPSAVVMRWLHDGTGLAVSTGLGQHWSVYRFDAGWSSVNSGLRFAERERRFAPQDTQIVIRQDEANTQQWDVFTVNPTDRSEEPISTLQNLDGSPSLHWSPLERHLLLLIYTTTEIQLAHVDWQTDAKTPLLTFSSSIEINDVFFSPDDRWAAVVTQTTRTDFDVYVVNLTTRDVWRAAGAIHQNGVAGFLPG